MIKLTKLWNVIFVSKNYAMGRYFSYEKYFLFTVSHKQINKKKTFERKKANKKTQQRRGKKFTIFFTLKAQKKTQLGMDEPKFRRLFS